MLQQTTVNAVIPYYQKWVKKYPSMESVAKANEQDLLKMWQGLGYYSRVRNIKKAANLFIEKFEGIVPKDPELLRKIPGFGPYTVGAVLSIAYDLRVPIIDANVRRVFMRLLGIEGYADTSKDSVILDILNGLMPQKKNNIFNQALMELGALVCRSKEPLCVMCPVNHFCAAYDRGIQEIIPTPKKKVINEIDVSIAVIKKGGKYFIQQRSSSGLLAGLWEFPGGKVEKGEAPLVALKREIKEELDVDLKSAKHMMDIVHYYTSFKVRLHVYLCELEQKLKLEEGRKWVFVNEFNQYPMPSGSAKIVEKLISQ